MAIEVASVIDGQISEDDKETWLSVEEFKTKHKDLLNMTYDEAVDISLEEIKVLKAIDDPIWEELDRKREEYIRIHGEVELDDEDDEWLYIKGDYTKEIPFDYLELAKRMWFDTKDGKTVDISYFGNTRPFKTDPTIHLKLNKWMHDNRWNNVQLKEGIINKFGSHVWKSWIRFWRQSNNRLSRKKGDCLRLASTHLDLLTVDKRAFYIMAIEIATAIDGQISEDDKESWLSGGI